MLWGSAWPLLSSLPDLEFALTGLTDDLKVLLWHGGSGIRHAIRRHERVMESHECGYLNVSI